MELLKTGLGKKILEISGKNFTLKTSSMSFEFVLTLLLLMISFVYGAVVRIRVMLYAKKILKRKKLPCTIISIGNITAGGSGKTPVTIYLAEALKKKGLNPVVLSRGYGGKKENSAVVAGNGTIIMSSSEDAGDEPYMMAKRCSFPVIVGKNRFKTGMMAVKLFCPDVIILDDGFQHIQLQRDIDIVLLDCKNPFGNGRLLPAGRLRELPVEAEKRADVFIFTRCSMEKINACNYKNKNRKDNHNNGTDRRNCINTVETPYFYTRHKPFLYVFQKYNKPRDKNFYKTKHHETDQCKIAGNKRNKDEINEKKYNLKDLRGTPAFLFSGIADNKNFRQTVEHLNIPVKDHLEFTDHYRYNKQDIEIIIQKAHKSKAKLIVTTEKDYARLCSDIDWKMDMAVIGIEIDWSADREKNDTEFIEFILKKIASF